MQRGSSGVAVFSTLNSKQQQQQALQLVKLRQFDDQRWSPLHHAAFRGYIKSLDRFLRLDEQHEANEAERRKEATPKISVTSRRLTAFEADNDDTPQPQVRLVELTTDDHVGFTPLHLAICGGHIEIVKCLINDHGANVDARNFRGHGPVQLAAFGRQIGILDYLATGRWMKEDGDDETRDYGGDVSSRSAADTVLNTALVETASDVWNQLAALLQSNDEDEVKSTAESILGLLLLHSMPTKPITNPGQGSRATNKIGSLYKKLSFEAGVVKSAVQLVKAAVAMPRENTERNETKNATPSSHKMASAAAALGILVSLMSTVSSLEHRQSDEKTSDNNRRAKDTPVAPDNEINVAIRAVDEAVTCGVLPSAVRIMSAALTLDDRARTAAIVRSASRLLTLVACRLVPVAKDGSSVSKTTGMNYARQAVDSGAIPALINVLKNVKKIADTDEDIYNVNNIFSGATTKIDACSNPLEADVAEAVGFLSENNQVAQNAIASIRDAPEVIIQLYDDEEEDHANGSIITDEDSPVDGSVSRRRRDVTVSDGTAVGQRRHFRHRRIELVTTRVIAKMVTGHRQLQSGFVGAGVTSRLITMLRRPGGDVATLEAAVEAIWRLADGNADVQEKFVTGPDMCDTIDTMATVASDDADDIVTALLDVATRPPGQLHQQRIQERENHAQMQRRIAALQRQTVRALWHVTGNDVSRQRRVAERIGVERLVEFIDLPRGITNSTDLSYVGSEALRALFTGADIGRHLATAAECGAVQSLVRLLRSDKEATVLSAIRTLRHLVVSVGYRVNRFHQEALLESRGIKLLTALSAHAENQLIRAEASYTLASASMGRADVITEICQNFNFSYPSIIGLIREGDTPLVQSLAGCSLATFGYNNKPTQMAISTAMSSDSGSSDGRSPLSFSDFIHRLGSDNIYIRCHAAFQVVVLAGIFSDVKPAVASAAGIKLLVDILSSNPDPATTIGCSVSDGARALAADCVARLAHTRHGIREAFVAISTVHYLLDLLKSSCPLVSGNATVALSYLSHDPLARRQLLKRCRKSPDFMDLLGRYSDVTQVSNKLFDDWQHYKQFTKLPAVSYSSPVSLVAPPSENRRRLAVHRKSSTTHHQSHFSLNS